MKAPRPSRRDSLGLETVEMAIILPVFLLLLFAILDFGRLFFTEITLQHAMREGGRFGVTGQRLTDPTDPRNFQSRLESIKRIVREAAVGVQIDPSDIHVTAIGDGGRTDDPGGPGDTFTISMDYRFLFITPMVGRFFDNGTHRFTVSTTFRSEPYPPSAGS